MIETRALGPNLGAEVTGVEHLLDDALISRCTADDVPIKATTVTAGHVATIVGDEATIVGDEAVV